ncbi:hypothetical protein RB608_10305 [Nocardioides sp. LHD-245]|uniref:hypothetical protein n=1 Tax=Nocardioides sp. LHD-245 TaxID=3051387 RepID=UPI0027DF8E02|nr:hypothetical protein [Nocardioides sp. LHD-245]
MTNGFRDSDDLIGLPRVADVPPPMMGATARPGGPSTGPRRASGVRGTRATRPTAATRPGVTGLTGRAAMSAVIPPDGVRAPRRAVAPDRPLLAAVTATAGRRGAEPVTWVVTALAWLMMFAAAGNAYFLMRTGGWIGSGLPFADFVDYSGPVNGLLTWGGHVGWPMAFSLLGAAGLACAAGFSRGLRQVGGVAGTTIFVGVLAALLGITGTAIAVAMIAFATALGIAIFVAMTLVFIGLLFALLLGAAD